MSFVKLSVMRNKELELEELELESKAFARSKKIAHELSVCPNY